MKSYVTIGTAVPFWGRTQSLTQVIINGGVDDFISRNVSIGLCRLCPAELSDSWAQDIKGQTTWFTRHWRTQSTVLKNTDTENQLVHTV